MDTATSPVTLNELTTLCKNYSKARDALDELSGELRIERQRVVRKRMRGLRTRVADVSAAKDALMQAIKASPEVFERPRSRSVEGIKIGFRKKPGTLNYNPPRSIRLIREQIPEQAEALIQIKESIVASAVKNLDAGTLARIGISMTGVDDEPFITVAKSDLDKLVDALLEDLPDEMEVAA